jgi:hypothetical protein
MFYGQGATIGVWPCAFVNTCLTALRLLDRNEEALGATAERPAFADSPLVLPVDTADGDAVQAAVDLTAREFGQIEHFVE